LITDIGGAAGEGESTRINMFSQLRNTGSEDWKELDLAVVSGNLEIISCTLCTMIDLIFIIPYILSDISP
tara:strand:- start:650 stop:859 length:210 start_codon:yes stop_codon:yes gene_type:complete